MKTLVVTEKLVIDIVDDGRTLADADGNYINGLSEVIVLTSVDPPLRIRWRGLGGGGGDWPVLSPEELYTFEIEMPPDEESRPRILKVFSGKTLLYDDTRE
jgi:hypothetical protein